MEKTRNKPKELFPYGMLLIRLFKHVVSIFPELAIDHYISYDRVMHPLAPHYKRNTRSDHGKKRPRDSNASSSSTTLNHPSSFHSLDDIIDENDEESFRSNSYSPSQNVSSSSNVVSRVLQNPPHESQHLNTYLFVLPMRYGYVKYHKKSVKKRTRERMSDQEAKEIKAEARSHASAFYSQLQETTVNQTQLHYFISSRGDFCN
ncbi:hypothetical protein Tco_1073543 [Tanacetum coccineum]